MAVGSNYPSVQPSLSLDFANGQILDSRISFTRGSTGAYYPGTSVLAEQNLLTYSQDYTNAVWTKTAVTITAAATTAPDGTTTGQTVTPDTSTGTHNISTATIGTATNSTLTVCAKANGYTFINLRLEGTSNFFNISTGVVGTIASGSTATVTAINNGWYRCSVTRSVTVPTGIAVRVATADNTDSFTGDGTSGIYLWGAQLEQRSSATAYNATTTSALTNYIPQLLTAPINQPRFDHDPVLGTSLGLLIEQSSTNLLTYSQDFSNAAWSKARCSITSFAGIAPDGTQTMQLLVEDTTASNSHPTFRTVTGFVSGTSYTFYAYIKPYGRTQANLAVSNTAFPSTTNVYFDISAGTIVSSTNATGTITAVGNGVYRCTLTATASASGSGDVYIQPAVSGSTIYTGNGYSGIYIWGAQIEALAFATSYIPTTTSTVTRSADSALISGTNFSPWYNQPQGTFYTEYARSSTVNQLTTVFCAYADTNNYVNYYGSAGNDFLYAASQGTAAVLNQTYGSVTTSYKKFAVSLAVNNVIATYGGVGVTPVVDNTYPQPNNFTSLGIGQNYSSGATFNGWIKKISYYQQALTSAQIQTLTSY